MWERERREYWYKINDLLQKKVGLRQLSSIHVVCWSHRGYVAQIQLNIIPRGQILSHPVIYLSAVRELQAKDPYTSKAGKDDIRLNKSPGKVHDLWKWLWEGHLRMDGDRAWRGTGPKRREWILAWGLLAETQVTVWGLESIQERGRQESRDRMERKWKGKEMVERSGSHDF